jgi:hypothetical protein
VLSFVGRLYTTPRVGQNAVLGSLRTVIPGAAEYGAHSVSDGRLVFSTNRPVPIEEFDTNQIGDPVWLSRRDRVAQAISWTVAAQTGQFRSEHPRRSVTYARTDIQAALDTIDDQERHWGWLLRNERYLRLWYEDDVERDPRVAAAMILDWWSIDGVPGEPGLVRRDADVKAVWRHLWDEGA